MQILTLDFETYWDSKYTLKKLTVAEYVNDLKFNIHMLGVKLEDEGAHIIPPTDLGRFINGVNWDNVAVLCHNAAFDGYVLEHIFGAKPRLYLDTIGMSRFLLGKKLPSLSLANVAKYLEVGEKGDELASTNGVERLDGKLYGQLAAYCKNDVDITFAVAGELLPQLNRSEVLLNDWTIKCFVRPQLMLNGSVVANEVKIEKQRRSDILADVGCTIRELRSDKTFSQMLAQLGVEAEMKPGKKGPIPCFAKTDSFLQNLLSHEDEVVRKLAKARWELKTSYAISRLERFKTLAGLAEKTPIALNYAGAMQTARWSGGGKTNFQNLSRSAAEGGISPLRKAIIAPPGFLLVAGDSSQIEARGLAVLAGAEQTVADFRAGKDPYIAMAAYYYNKPEAEITKAERQFGKILVLASGYGMGGVKFKATAANEGVILTLEEARGAIRKYREVNFKQAALWWYCNDMIPVMANGLDPVEHPSKMFKFIDQGIECCTDFVIKYPKLKQVNLNEKEIQDLRALQGRHDVNHTAWKYYDAGTKSWPKLYGGKIVENIVQHLTGRCVGHWILALTRMFPDFPPALMVHDEIVSVVPEAQAEQYKAAMEEVMSAPPSWWPDLPVGCEVNMGVNYGECK